MFPSLEEVRVYAEDGRYKRVPICAELYADRTTPVEVLRCLRASSAHCFLFESAEQGGRWGRYSFLGYNPSMEIACTNGTLRIRYGNGSEPMSDARATHAAPAASAAPDAPDTHAAPATPATPAASATPAAPATTTNTQADTHNTPTEEVRTVEHPKHAIREVLARYASPQVPGMPPLAGGLVGYFSYDYIKYDEPRLMEQQLADRDFRDVDLMLFDQMIVFDHHRQKLFVIAGVDLSCAERDGLEAAYARAQDSIQNSIALLKSGASAFFPPLHLREPLALRFSEEAFSDMVLRAKHYIREGDIFQVVLSNPQTAAAEGSLLDVYRVLRTTNPSPYMFYFTSDDIEIAGASPETLGRLENGRVQTFPLAGTRPRGANREEDEALERELLADEKELAEHNMLVDLGRNDLGRICTMGSVNVDNYLSIHRFSHVMHIGSEVSGAVRDDCDALDAVDAILPAGTLSGAPKLRACQIIQELEGSKRGIYGGAVGYLDFTGNLDTCISIRLAYKKDGRICVQSGAGIVADSDPASEFAECKNKARAVVAAIEEAEGGLA